MTTGMKQSILFAVLAAIVLAFEIAVSDASVHANLAPSIVHRPRFRGTVGKWWKSKGERRRDSQLLATARLTQTVGGGGSSADNEARFTETVQEQLNDKDKEQKQNEIRLPLTPWHRLFTRTRTVVLPKVQTKEQDNVSLVEETDDTNDTAVDSSFYDPLHSFLANDTIVDDTEAFNEARVQQTQRRPMFDAYELVPALALPSSLSLSSIRTKIFTILRHPQFPKWTLNGLQLGLALYLLNAVVKAAAEVIDELGGDASPHLLKVDQVKQIIASLDSNDNTASFLLQQQPTLQHLTETLLASGMPLRSEEENSIERVLLSLTRSEASLLQQCLWTPSKGASPTSFADITGLHSIKQSLLDLVWTLKSQKHSNPFAHFIERQPGILLYGPPGCGKTLLVKALAGAANLPCLVVTPSVLLRKYVGDTNLQVRALFSLAQKLSPCIVCIDELDGLFRERSSTEHDVSRDLKTEFLQWWDGIASDGRILIVGATNRPFEVDSAVLRRMPQSYFVGLPNYEARRNLLSSLLGSIPTSPGLSLHPLAAETEGYTPSDLRQVVRMAVTMGPIREARFSLKYRPLSMNDVVQARSIVSPTPLTPGYRSALMEYAQRNTANVVSNDGNNQNPWDSFYNAGTIHAFPSSGMPEWNEDGDVESQEEEEEYSYEQESETDGLDD